MKTIPTIIHRHGETPVQISRQDAADRLRHARRTSKARKWRDSYLIAHPAANITVPPTPRPHQPTTYAIAKRLTHAYATGWNHLDRWHGMGNVTVSRVGRRREGDDGGYSQIIILSTDADATRYRPANIIRAIDATLTASCRCQHDCCGHMQRGVSNVRKLPGNRYAVITYAYPNV